MRSPGPSRKSDPRVSTKDLVGASKAVFPWIGCGQCRDCLNGDENLCVKQRFLGVAIDGGFASHVLVPDARYLLDYDPLQDQSGGDPDVLRGDRLWCP